MASSAGPSRAASAEDLWSLVSDDDMETQLPETAADSVFVDSEKAQHADAVSASRPSGFLSRHLEAIQRWNTSLSAELEAASTAPILEPSLRPAGVTRLASSKTDDSSASADESDSSDGEPGSLPTALTSQVTPFAVSCSDVDRDILETIWRDRRFGALSFALSDGCDDGTASRSSLCGKFDQDWLAPHGDVVSDAECHRSTNSRKASLCANFEKDWAALEVNEASNPQEEVVRQVDSVSRQSSAGGRWRRLPGNQQLLLNELRRRDEEIMQLRSVIRAYEGLSVDAQ